MLQDLQDSGMVINLKKSHLEPTQEIEHLGFNLNLKENILQVPCQKLKSVQRELGKILVRKDMSCRNTAASHFRAAAKFFDGTSLPQSIFRPAGQFHKPAQATWLGQESTHPKGIARAGQGNRNTSSGMEREKFSGKKCSEKNFLRLLDTGVGGSGLNVRGKTPGVLEVRNGPPQQYQGAESVNFSLPKFGKRGGNNFSHSRQSGSLQLSQKKKGGDCPPFNRLMRPFLLWCQSKNIRIIPNWVKSQDMLADSITRVRGLHFRQKDFSSDLQIICRTSFTPKWTCSAVQEIISSASGSADILIRGHVLSTV
jgi:hypothetical protein